ncbi:tyrosine-type recombinase/integrase [Paenibacillus graminis]|uniref:tyrosine-type recombinase/integrase n=2 Tax=Paenibacillus graminis TaxID=189425 RepID=UPI0030C9362C
MDKRTGKRYKNDRIEVGGDKSLYELFDVFYHAKIAEGRALRTLEMYRESFRYLCEYLEARGIERTLTAVTTEELRSFTAYLLHEKRKWDGHPHKSEANMTVGLDPVTVNTKIGKLRTMFNFLEADGHILHNPFAKVRKVREPEKEIRIMTEDELKLMLAAPDQRTYVGFRDFVLMNVLLDSFARISEVVTLDEDSVDTVHGSIYINEKIAKSRKGRTIPIQKRTARLIAELRKECADFGTELIFCTNYGGKLTDDRVRERLKEYAEKAGVNINVHPHLFRHTAATMFLANGGSEIYLQKLMGHADLRMLEKYAHPSAESIREKHDKFSPVNNVISGLQRPRRTKR